MSDAVITTRSGRVLLITLNRPEHRNAIDGAMCRGLIDAVAELESDGALSSGVITGVGKGFCAGMDLKAFAKEGTPKELHRFFREGCSKPLIAAVEGFAYAGGLEVALTCDLIVAARGAKLGIPEAKVGLFAAGGALLRLPRRLPSGIAMEMALTGAPITAVRGHELGLVNQLTDPGRALEGALALAERIAANAPLAVAASKALIRDTHGVTDEEFWSMQRGLFSSVFSSQDAKEGSTAFAQKREPAWTGT
jgi:enoyl-CoA hydratase